MIKMALPEKREEEQLKEGECDREGDVVYCRERGKIETYPIEEAPGSTSETAIIGFILGILGIVLLPLPFIGISSALLATLFSGAGVYQTRRRLRRGFSLALTGFILGIAGIVAFIALIAGFLSFGASMDLRL